MTGSSPPRSRGGLAAKLVTAQLLVVVVGAVTAWLVAALVGPRLFHQHLEHAGPMTPQNAARHAEQAYVSASAIALSLALFAALSAALAVSVYLNRRIGRSVAAVSAAATQVAEGGYRARVVAPGLGVEFDELARAFNSMAGRLHSTETTRRRLLADLAHEMRTPVATLEAYLEALEDGVAALDPETVAVLRAQTARLTRLSQDITAVSRAEEGQLQLSLRPTAVAGLVAEAVATVQDRFEAKGVSLRATVQDGLPDIQADPERLAQVLGNLLDNALRHTPAGGSVNLLARAATRAEPAVELVVSDTGEGIAAEHLPHVFERLYRADTARDRLHGGSGIGLTIVKALVEAHSGHVMASSDGPGTGATFTVELPMRGAPSRAAAAPLAEDPPAS